jgi:elongation factor Tu
VKPQLKILSFGDNFQSRLSLIAGLHNQSANKYQTHAFDLAPHQNSTSISKAETPILHLEHQSEEKLYHHTLLSHNNKLPSNTVTNLAYRPQYDGAIWVIEELQAPIAQTSLLKVLRCCGAALLIFLDAGKEQHEQELDLLELTLRESCELAGLSGNEGKIIRGDSTKESAVQTLYEACDEAFFPRPTRPDTFMMPIEDVFDIKRKGLVVSGCVERGTVKAGQELELLGIRPMRRVTAIGIEAFRRSKDFAEAGQNIGMMLRGVKRIEIERGQVLAQPGTIQVSDSFEAEVHFSPANQSLNYPPWIGQPFDIVLYSWRGQATLTAGEFIPHAFSWVTIRTEKPIALETLLSFAIIARARPAGYGLVTKIFDSARFL